MSAANRPPRGLAPVLALLSVLLSVLLAALMVPPSRLSGQVGPDGPDGAAAPAPGVSLALARERAATLSGLAYALELRVPAEREAPVTGAVTIRVRRTGDGPLVLDFAHPDRVAEVRVGGRAASWRGANGHLVIPAAELAPGENEVRVAFAAGDGPLNRRDDFLYTLFVPARAHEAFPAFDQPDLKARFTLTLTVPAGWTAVANGEVAERREAEGGVVYRFRETEPLPTYLFAFAAGRFEVEEAERDGRRLRLIHRETDGERVARNREAIFDLHARSLRWLEEYTGIPYPFGKFDVVAIPSFQYNGMEHPGAILYRASSLFLDESATRNQELGRASVIAHETAHMWFGDLVTMRWFDDVWMKEVFANFMAAKIVNPSFPELDHELRFLLAHYPAAYAVDRTDGANPIRQPLDNLADAGTLYGAIIYQKAPIVMRQLERLTGEAPFRAALRRYLEAHAFGNAGWPDLVAELDAVTPLDVAAWSRVWVEEPGRPTVTVHRRGPVLSQSDARGRDITWPQRTTLAAWAPGVRADTTVTLEGAVTEAPLPEAGPAAVSGGAALVPNADGLGYALFLLDDATTRRLLRELPAVEDPVLRAAAWLDVWEMMLEGAVAPDRVLALAMAMIEAEPDELVLQQLLGDLETLYWRFLSDDARRGVGERLEGLLWARLEAAESASRKAALLNAWRDVATTDAAVRRMAAVWAGDLEIDGLPLSDADRTTLALHLAVRDAPDAASILDRQAAAIENPDRAARFAFIRPAVAADPAVRDSFFHSLAAVESRAREEWVVTALRYLHHPLRAERSLGYLRPSLTMLREIQATGDIFFPTRWLAATLGGHASPEAADVVRAFLDGEGRDLPPRLRGKLLQEADPLFRAVAISR